MTIEENVLLAPFTTFRTGGSARFFCRVKNSQDLNEALAIAEKKRIDIFVLGQGSNILVSDDGTRDLVIKNEISGINELAIGAGAVRVTAGGGENWDNLVSRTVSQGLSGLENLSLIPGTVGAAPVQNIGAYGREVKDCILSVMAIDTVTKELKRFSNSECQFAYRDSFFKKSSPRYIITEVSFELHRDVPLITSYKDIEVYKQVNGIGDYTLETLRDAVVAIRTKKLPDVTQVGTAGSFFKNPVITKDEHEKLLQKYPDLHSFPAQEEGMVKISAAWILDKVCGLKGARRGNVGVHDRQALVIVNFGGGTSKEIVALANEMSAAVEAKTGITLEWEVQKVGRF